MPQSFANLEKSLRTFFEEGLGGFSSSSLLTSLIEQSIGEIRDLTQGRSKSLKFAPDQFVIRVNAKTLEQLNKDRHWQEKFLQAVERETREAGMVFQSPPDMQMILDDTLGGNEFSIDCRWQADSPGKTKAMISTGGGMEAAAESLVIGSLIISGEIIPLDRPVINIGRRTSNDIVLHDPRVSRQHAQIRLGNGSATIFDLDSTGGTYVNNNRINSQVLVPGDVISLAGCQIIYNQETDLGRTDRLVNKDEAVA